MDLLRLGRHRLVPHHERVGQHMHRALARQIVPAVDIPHRRDPQLPRRAQIIRLHRILGPHRRRHHHHVGLIAPHERDHRLARPTEPLHPTPQPQQHRPTQQRPYRPPPQPPPHPPRQPLLHPRHDPLRRRMPVRKYNPRLTTRRPTRNRPCHPSTGSTRNPDDNPASSPSATAIPRPMWAILGFLPLAVAHSASSGSADRSDGRHRASPSRARARRAPAPPSPGCGRSSRAAWRPAPAWRSDQEIRRRNPRGA